jgi:hypothetical protein
MTGESRYGPYYLYALKIKNEEYSFFAPNEIHDSLKTMRKGDKAILFKRAEQQGKKIITLYDVTMLNSGNGKAHTEEVPATDNYFTAMLASYEDAMNIQEKLNGMVDVNRIAITLFIARSKLNGGRYE